MGSRSEAETAGIRKALFTALGAVSIAILAVNGAHAEAQCQENAVFLRGPFGEARFTIEVADTPEERAQGLMFRETMPKSAGMLFVYPHPQPVAFWMQNTLIPLDMIFVDETGLVRSVHHMAKPMDRTSISGGDDILLVLEINGGLARAMGIKPGDQLRHLSILPDLALWPC